jgi:hypothetical protein
VDQKAPPAALIPIATRNLPVGAISPLRPSAKAGIVITPKIIVAKARPAKRGTNRLDIAFFPLSFSLDPNVGRRHCRSLVDALESRIPDRNDKKIAIP